MKLLLMRHGDAVAAENERPLTEQGRKESARAGEFLYKINEIPDIILHSGITRSRQIAEGVAAAAGFRGDLLIAGRTRTRRFCCRFHDGFRDEIQSVRHKNAPDRRP
jgi:phosphohistidine phosphatase SixA